MAYVVTSRCIGTLDRSCVLVCPVDCFYRYRNPLLNEKYNRPPKKVGEEGMLVINPNECINCAACETECPVEAIHEDTCVPPELQEFIAINEEAVAGLSDRELDELRVTSRP